jgi:hypothetical protein
VTAVRPWRWAVMGLLFVGPVVAVVVDARRPEPSGHWSGHLGSAAVAVGVALSVVIAAGLVRRRLSRLAIGAVSVTLIGLVLEAVGNWRAARSLWATGFDDEVAAMVGPAHEGYEWGHTVAGWGDAAVVIGGLLLAVSLRLSRHVGLGVALACGVLAFFPPWIYPAMGVLLGLAWLHARRRHQPSAGRSGPAHVAVDTTAALVHGRPRHARATRLRHRETRVGSARWIPGSPIDVHATAVLEPRKVAGACWCRRRRTP